VAFALLAGCTRPPPIERPAPSATPAAGTRASAAAERRDDRSDGLQGGTIVFQDDFERPELGSQWQVGHGPAWRLENGWVHGTTAPNDDDKNRGLWLMQELPEKARIEFEAKSLSDIGDTKCEVFNTEPRHEAGYAIIFGGWRNTINTIARMGEHEPNRVEQKPHVRVQKGKVYKWAIVRNDNVVRWYIDGRLMISYDDKQPIAGRYFGFNNWATDVWYDSVRVYQL